MYCTNCGNKLEKNQKYCTSCGFNNIDNESKNNNDQPNIGLNIIGFLWPLVGLIIFLCLKDTTPKKAKKVGKWSIIGFIAKIVISIICFILLITFAVFIDEDSREHHFNDYYDYDEYDYDIKEFAPNGKKENNELDNFIDAIEYYNLLATKQFYEEAYTNKELTDVCYDIKELEKTNHYEGSIEVKMENNKLQTYIWLTDYEYVINGIDYENYKYQDIKKGDKIINSCKSIDNDNSL